MDNAGNLLLSDSILNRIHVFSPASGELSSIASFGHAFYRSSRLAVSIDGLLAVYQQRGVEDSEGGVLCDPDSASDSDCSGSEQTDEADDEPASSETGNNSIKREVAIYRLIRADL
jgi:hypothetical protein